MAHVEKSVLQKQQPHSDDSGVLSTRPARLRQGNTRPIKMEKK